MKMSILVDRILSTASSSDSFVQPVNGSEDYRYGK